MSDDEPSGPSRGRNAGPSDKKSRARSKSRTRSLFHRKKSVAAEAQTLAIPFGYDIRTNLAFVQNIYLKFFSFFIRALHCSTYALLHLLFCFFPSLSYMHTYAFHLHMRTSIARFSICLFCVNLLLTLLCALTVTCFLSRLFDASFSDFFSFPFLSLFEQDLQSAPCQRVVSLFLYLHSLHGHHNLLLTGYPIISHH